MPTRWLELELQLEADEAWAAGERQKRESWQESRLAAVAAHLKPGN